MYHASNNELKKVLTIAGSDSGGGAGIQADLKTFAARGVYGMSVITALTAQNTVGVQGIFEIPPAFVALQIDSVIEDIGVDAVKIGMLSNKDNIQVVAAKVRQYHIGQIVLDPVMVAKSGDFLLQKDSKLSLIKDLLPLAFVLTPNLPEASAITGLEINTIEQMKKAAVVLFKMGPKNIIVKGGHRSGNQYAVDILYDGKNFFEFKSEKINTPNTHGTGCTFSSAIAAELAKGNNIYDSVKFAKEYITEAIKSAAALKIGHGHGPLDHIAKTRLK